MGESDGVSGSWLHLDPTLAVVAIWGMNEQIQDLELSVCLSVSVNLSPSISAFSIQISLSLSVTLPKDERAENTEKRNKERRNGT